jgi:hypothetical protein
LISRIQDQSSRDLNSSYGVFDQPSGVLYPMLSDVKMFLLSSMLSWVMVILAVERSPGQVTPSSHVITGTQRSATLHQKRNDVIRYRFWPLLRA